MYLLVCLGFVVFALLEFSLVMFRNRSFSGCLKVKRNTVVEARNKIGFLEKMKPKDGPNRNTNVNEKVEKKMKTADKTDAIAFGIYLLLFVLFNIFYWSHFLALHCKWKHFQCAVSTYFWLHLLGLFSKILMKWYICTVIVHRKVVLTHTPLFWSPSYQIY